MYNRGKLGSKSIENPNANVMSPCQPERCGDAGFMGMEKLVEDGCFFEESLVSVPCYTKNFYIPRILNVDRNNCNS